MFSLRRFDTRFIVSIAVSLFLLVSLSLIPAPAPASAQSDEVVREGGGKRGLIGPDLGDDEWKYGSKGNDIYMSISAGRPGGMPPFNKTLKDEQIWEVVSYIQSMTQELKGIKKMLTVKKGEQGYRENCAVCHGADGKGKVGPSLLDIKKWKYGATDEKIYQSIAKGRSGAMHGWQKYLGDEQIWEIVAYVKNLSSKEKGDHKMDVLAAKGKNLYLENCGACHGPEATGRRGPSLIDKDWKYGSTDKKVFESISKGRHGGDMPSFIKSIGKDKIWKIIAYLRSIAEKEEEANIRKVIKAGEKTYKLRCAVCHGKDIRAFAVPPPPFSEGIFPCSDCHEDMEVNRKRRKLTEEHTNINLTHAAGQRWCLDCHDAENRDVLHLVNGEKVQFTESYKLCGQCHGDKYRDWRAGVHGKRTGFWDGQKQYLLCAHCHNPHSPRFKPLIPLPPPKKPEDIR